MTDVMLELLDAREETRLNRFFRRRLGNRDEAADATQETLLRMLEASHSTLIENPQAYLFQVARSVARMAKLRQHRDGNLFLAEEFGWDQADETPLPDRVVMGRESLLLMAKSIEQLPKRCQQVFILSRLRGFSNGEIAAQLDITRNMVEKHIIRALLHCRKVRAELSI